MSEQNIPNADQPKIERGVRYLDTFTRKTIYIEANLLEKIQELSSVRRGEQTRIINAAIGNYLASSNKVQYARPDKADLARKTVYIEKDLLDEFMEYCQLHDLEQIEVVHNALASYLSDPANVEKHGQVMDWYAKPFWKSIHIHE
jgi:hypothetical protein